MRYEKLLIYPLEWEPLRTKSNDEDLAPFPRDKFRVQLRVFCPPDPQGLQEAGPDRHKNIQSMHPMLGIRPGHLLTFDDSFRHIWRVRHIQVHSKL